MYGKYTTLSSSAPSNNNSSESTSRMAVADILSTMAVNGHEPITPSTYAALEGFSTGVLTQTTPTLTPTTLRSIEQTFIELQAVPPPHSLTRHSNEAGFVPPIVNVLPSAASVISAIANHGLQLPPTTTNGSTVIVPSPSDSTTTLSSTAAFLGGDAHNGSTMTTYQTLTAKSVASIGGCNSSNNDGNGMSSSASSSGSSTTSASDIINDNNSWSGIGNNNNNSSRGGGRTSGGQTASKAKGRNMGGRRPAKYEKLTPEEEERRRVRRERNKLAAARCRKRRMDHTNSLIYETEGLEDQRSSLQSEIQDLQSQKDELEFILEAHKVVCKLQRQALQHCHREHRDRSSHQQEYGRDDDIELSHPQPEQGQKVHVQREEPVDVKPDLSQLNVAIQQHQAKRSRPNSLALSSTFAVPRGVPQQQQQQQQHPATSGGSSANRLSLTEATGISITTPSNGMFNFEALMEGGTGLTPVSSSGGTGLTPIAVPSCSTQQRSSSSNNNNGDCLSSPEGSLNGPPKLVSL